MFFFCRSRWTHRKFFIFLSLYFYGYFSEGTPSEKYFSDGIRIFLCVFAHTEKSEFPVVMGRLLPIWRREVVRGRGVDVCCQFCGRRELGAAAVVELRQVRVWERRGVRVVDGMLHTSYANRRWLDPWWRKRLVLDGPAEITSDHEFLAQAKVTRRNSTFIFKFFLLFILSKVNNVHNCICKINVILQFYGLHINSTT